MFEQQFLGMVPMAPHIGFSGPWMGQDGPPEKMRVKPTPVGMPASPVQSGMERERGPAEAERAEKRESRICEMLKRFSENRPGSGEESEARSHIFWSYVRHQAARTGRGEDAVAQAVQARCPDMTLPPKPSKGGAPKPPEREGFHGKTRLPYAEAKELSDLLTVVLTPLTPEEAAKELAREECLRDIVRADGFPIVDRLQERLKDFLATAKQTDTFEISHGEAVVTGKAVECAEAIGRIKTVRTVATVGGAAAGGVGLLWLIGIL